MDEITVDKFSSTRNVTVLHCTVENQGYVFLKICIIVSSRQEKTWFFSRKIRNTGCPTKERRLEDCPDIIYVLPKECFPFLSL